ncbi:hypothetical protein D9758_001779 [Tetrapyrgos nigripes]|uniref:DNA-(apurinic or apyrimidinic site) endonuclease 2 n=1 Tax=Tetrapyrgos nigripes TaxID=182062 RepID=A0A8H5GY79_9AGAR|nr:hypothetical protein D9758_001779 [Tetrapyrgos nigripes]
MQRVNVENSSKNGIRTVPQYHPWNTLNSFDDILNYLEADIINFQEVKQARNALPKNVAIPPSYDSFFSFPIHKNGYSGVATYTRMETVVPLKAEEGITGLLHFSSGEGRRRNGKQPKLVLTREERVSSPDSSYPGLSGVDDNSDDEGHPANSLPRSESDLKLLDAEGRTLVLDFGLFVLINVYCPNDGSADETDSNNRIRFKTDFHNVLEARIKSLIREGREVILVGDLNACATINDHCEGEIIVKRVTRERQFRDGEDMDPEEIFWEEKQWRRWLRDLIIGEKKCFVDVTRVYHPERKEMYTCWNTKLSARDSNYGTRIDYILVTPNLLPWIKFSDIQPQIKGSDHCPVFVDFHHEREIDGRIVKLRDLLVPSQLSQNVKRDPPRLAARFWDEYSGKQRVLDSFFKSTTAKKQITKGKSATISVPDPSPRNTDQSLVSVTSTTQVTNTISVALSEDPIPLAIPSSSLDSESGVPSLKRPRSPSSDLAVSEASPIATQSKKVRNFSNSMSQTMPAAIPSQSKSSFSKISISPKEEEEKPKKLKAGQAKLSGFFTAPATGKGKGKQKEGSTGVKKGKTSSKGKIKSDLNPGRMEVDLTMEDADMDDAVSLTPSTDPPDDTTSQEDADYRLALALSQESVTSSSTSSLPPPTPSDSSNKSTRKPKPRPSNADSGAAWKMLLTRPPPPRCTVHNEEAREFTVNKAGVNKGRSFWVCSRPVGPGYDKGRSDRPREEVDPKYKCSFFMWSSDWKKEPKK